MTTVREALAQLDRSISKNRKEDRRALDIIEKQLDDETALLCKLGQLKSELKRQYRSIVITLRSKRLIDGYIQTQLLEQLANIEKTLNLIDLFGFSFEASELYLN